MNVVYPLLLMLLAFCSAPAAFHTHPQDDDAVSEQQAVGERQFSEVSLAAFDEVWSTVVERAWNDDFAIDAWKQAKAELRPRVKSAASAHEVRQILRELIGRLHLSHYSIIPGDAYAEFRDESTQVAGDWESGLSIRIVEGRAIVSQVWEESDAFQQGIRTGWHLVAVRGKQTEKLLTVLNESLDRQSAYRPETLASLELASLLTGKPNATVDLSLLDCDQKPRQLNVALHQPPGHRTKFGHLPAAYVRSEVREVAEGVGYVRFSAFFAPTRVMAAVSDAIRMAGRGLIIDLRGNRGGLAGMTMGIGSRLVEHDRHQLGIQKMRDGELKYVLIPGAHSYLGPVAVLVDECSISSAELLAGGLQAIGRAQVIGTTSAGAALPSVFTKLPNGDFFQYAIADFVDSKGRQIEGTGVVPDIEIPLSQDALCAGRDPALDTAIDWIEEQASKPQTRKRSNLEN